MLKTDAATALVLGGGGPLGIAWEVAMLDSWAAAAETPVPLAPFLDGRIIGTSAGAVVGAHLAQNDGVFALLAQQDEPLGPDTPDGPDMTRFMAAFLKAKLFSRDLSGLRRSIGRSAISAKVPGEAEFLAAFARSYVPKEPWRAERELLLTVVDAATGEFHVWNAASAVPLPLAVAASCAVPCVYPLVHVNGRAYMDGGVGSSTNAALAAGCRRVVVLDPLGRMLGNSSPLDDERRALEASGCHTLAFTPDQDVANAVGTHLLDASRRAEVARLGRVQGAATAAGVWKFLSS